VDPSEIEASFRSGQLHEPVMGSPSTGNVGRNSTPASASSGGGEIVSRLAFDGGLSGATFYLTADEKFVLKSVRRRELQFLLRMLPSLLGYLVNHHASTFLPRYLALIRVSRRKDHRHYILQPNIFYCPHPLKGTLKRYDLKCSGYRFVTDAEFAAGKAVGKDLNFCHTCAELASSASFRTRQRHFVWELPAANKQVAGESCDHRKLSGKVARLDGCHSAHSVKSCTAISSDNSTADLLGALEKDVQLLASWGVVDFSLVVAVAECGTQVEWSNMGFIDCLQEYTIFKWAETAVRTKLMGETRKGVSSLPATEYSERFLSFLRAHC